MLYKRIPGIEFDPRVKWVVDIDFYIRYLEASGTQPFYISRILVECGTGRTQVTQDCFRQRPVEIPENFYLLNKVGYANLRNVRVYDAWWRLMRNLEIRRREDITGSGYTGARYQPSSCRWCRWQRMLPFRWWRIGLLSKTAMFLHYFSHYNQIAA